MQWECFKKVGCNIGLVYVVKQGNCWNIDVVYLWSKWLCDLFNMCVKFASVPDN